MNESAAQRRTSPVFYGWTIVAIGGLFLFFSGPGQTYSNALFIESYIEDLGWSRNLVSGIYSAATLCAGFLLYFIGSLIDRFGHRKMAVAIITLFAGALVWNSFITHPVMLFIGFFFIRLLGQGSMSLLGNTLIPQWFISKKGRAFSLMAIGAFISSALFPVINVQLIDMVGWRGAWLVLGIGTAVIMIPVVLKFLVNKPEDIGLLPDNAAVEPVEAEADGKDTVFTEISWTLKEAMRTYQFWLLLICVSIPALINTGLTFHIVSIFSSKGLTAGEAAALLSIMAVVGFPVTLAIGFILEKVQIRLVLAAIFVGQLLYLLVLQEVSTFTAAIWFAVLWGVIGGIERVTLAVVFPEYFGRRHIGSIKGFVTGVMVFGSALGPLPFALAYDMFGDYTEAVWLAMIIPAIGAAAAFLSTQPTKRESRLLR
ncbi:MFS transporter [Planococcus lenghuensis]|uniref:MFS transporter n=1 Tax=Planococcus lenghuensis TaxID=2213202 RepID=A0A1Q2L2A1_9BACL|nr:MFS transporter [Planococcus lenghuensis]AQQ54543.1 MFS transporter [Planococcus lenghuensis]